MNDLPHEYDVDFLDVFVVIPAYNEAVVLAQVIEGVARHIPPARIIVVNDASTDQTGNVARDCKAVVLDHLINRGQGAALTTGIVAVLVMGAKAIVTFDADGQHDPDDLPAMIRPILAGESDVVLGTRFGPGQTSKVPALRRVILKFAVLTTRLINWMKITDVHNGFRVFSDAAARTIRIRQDRMAHASEILDEIKRHKLRYVERPINVRYSEYSMTKGQNNREALRLALKVLFYKAGG